MKETGVIIRSCTSCSTERRKSLQVITCKLFFLFLLLQKCLGLKLEQKLFCTEGEMPRRARGVLAVGVAAYLE